jgi:hypothetical protein
VKDGNWTKLIPMVSNPHLKKTKVLLNEEGISKFIPTRYNPHFMEVLIDEGNITQDEFLVILDGISLINQSFLDLYRREEILEEASKLGWTQVVKVLIETYYNNPSLREIVSINVSICKASEYGHIDTVKYLLSNNYIEPNGIGYSIYIASACNRFEMVQMLLKDSRVDESTNWFQDSLYIAFEKEHTEIIKLLLNDSRIDPSSNGNLPIRAACKLTNPNEKETIVSMLIKRPGIKGILSQEEINYIYSIIKSY